MPEHLTKESMLKQVKGDPANTIVVTPNASMGTNGSIVSLEGTTISGRITFKTGLVSLAAGTVLTAVLPTPFPNKATVTFSPGNALFAAMLPNLYAETTEDTIKLKTNVALGVNSTYIGYYQISGY